MNISARVQSGGTNSSGATDHIPTEAEEKFLLSLRGLTFGEFWDKIGRPIKRGEPQPIYDYEQDIIDRLDSNITKHLWIVKSTGLGITELILRYIAYRCTRDDQFRGQSIPVIVGPNLDLAIKLIRRLKKLFEPHSVFFEDKQTVLNLNGVTIEAFPANHLSSFRSLESPALIYLSEADFFMQDSKEVVDTTERYIGKADPIIILESTPNRPDGLFNQISNDPNSLYTKIRLDYTIGLGKIYTEQEIARAKRSYSFEREYNLKYLGKIGNSFRQQDIEKAQSFEYNPDLINESSSRVIGIDPAWGSSAFGIVVTDHRDSKACVLLAEEHKHSTSAEMIPYVLELMQKYKPISKVYIDGSAVDFIRLLKQSIGEEADYLAVRKRYESGKMSYELNHTIIDVNFMKNNVSMLSHLRTILERGLLMIDGKRFPILIQALHNCSDDQGKVIKDFVGNDCFDALRLNMIGYDL